MVFRFLVGRTAKFFGRNTNLLFFTSLYREMFKELVEITRDETKASRILKMIGIHGTFESGRRQITVLRMFPNDPVKVMEYLDIIWYVIFGTKLDEYELEKIPKEGKNHPDLVFHITKCPICGGYGTSPLDSIDCNKIQSEESYYATGLVGMLEETANFILELKRNDYRILMQETKCFCRGDEELELICKIIHKSEFSQDIEKMDESLRRPFLDDSEIEIGDEIFSKPFNAIKEQLVSLIQDKMQMSTFELMEYFRGYEEDVVRILGFMGVHILNENGRLIEKACENDSLAKLLGHIYNNSVETANLVLPFDILDDYKKVIVEFLTDISPPDMIVKFNSIEPAEFIRLFYEGVKKALLDLGVNFTELKSNIWEEMEIHKTVEKITDSKEIESLSEEKKREQANNRLQLIQELYLLMVNIFSIPNKIFLTSMHATAKSLVTLGKENTPILREQISQVLDLIEKLK